MFKKLRPSTEVGIRVTPTEEGVAIEICETGGRKPQSMVLTFKPEYVYDLAAQLTAAAITCEEYERGNA